MPIRRVVVVLAVLLLAGCGSDAAAPPPAAPADGTIPVVASTNVYGSIADAVGGTHVSVSSLVSDPAADPHSFESTPADAAAVAGATLVVHNGGGYDDWMSEVVAGAGGTPTVIDVSELTGQAAGGEFNEHVWYSLPTVRQLADRIAGDLAAADPAHAAEFTANAEAFAGRVDELQARAQAIGAAHPGARVMVTEPVPGYLIQTAGLVDVTPPEFSEAVEEDTDPPAAVVQQTLDALATQQVRALIVNAQTVTPTTEQVRQAAQTDGVPVVEVTETLPAGTTDYTSWMGAQIDALAAALQKG
jgi:zinc/manganese transport system substrate-binding protein